MTALCVQYNRAYNNLQLGVTNRDLFQWPKKLLITLMGKCLIHKMKELAPKPIYYISLMIRLCCSVLYNFASKSLYYFLFLLMHDIDG